MFNPARLPSLVTFLRRTGLGFSDALRDGTLDDNPEADDLNVGKIVALTFDLDICMTPPNTGFHNPPIPISASFPFSTIVPCW